MQNNKNNETEALQLKNLKLIEEIKNGNKDKIVELMHNNYGVIHACIAKYIGPYSEYDDLMQEAYFATVRAVRAFDLKKGNRFTILLSIWLNHFMFRYVNKSNIQKAKHCVSLEELPFEGEDVMPRVQDFYPAIESSEDTYITYTLEELLWGEVNNILTKENFNAVYDAYKKQRSYTEIGKSLGIGRSGARLKVIRSLKKLKESKKIQMIAYDFFAIDNFRWED